jgi:WD40 repeat protein
MVWDAKTGKPLIEPLEHDDETWSVAFSPDGARIVTTSFDHTARVWDAQTGQPLTEPWEHRGAVVFAQFSPDGRRLVSASRDGSARVWDLAPREATCPDWLPEIAQAISGQVLNKHSFLEQTQLIGAGVLKELRQRLQQEPDDNAWSHRGRWFLENSPTRAISPFSTVTAAEYIEERIRENTPESLAQAERMAEGDVVFLHRIGDARKALQK